MIGNYYNKYKSKNPIGAFLLGRFVERIRKLLNPYMNTNILDIGCGEAYMLQRLQLKKVTGLDMDFEIASFAKSNFPSGNYLVSDGYNLPFLEKSYDFVMAVEVLEHVDNPDLILKEMQRISRKHVLLTVPHEPYWRILNMMRGAYLREFGNTPGHIQHWGRTKFYKYVEKHYQIVDFFMPLPWLVALCEIK